MVKDKVQEKMIRLFFTPIHTQLADLFTKALSSQQLRSLLPKMSILNIHNTDFHLEGEYQTVKDQRTEYRKKGKNDKRHNDS